ncbi:MAG: beta-N-acetylhexosaminidase [Rhodospirillales bacterium]
MAAARNPRAAIFGCEGLTLKQQERDFFRSVDPFGFILFARNCDSPVQIAKLAHDLRDAIGRADAPVLIDQEGGRVQRLKPPHWRQAPAARRFGELYKRDPAAGREAVHLNMRLIAAELLPLGVDVDCVPLLDVPIEGAHDVIGHRAFASEPEVVADLGRVVAGTMLEMGIMPVIKHLPGHGRAGVDSHFDLPRVDTPMPTLQHTDFLPFKALCNMPWGMTAHVLYTAIDAQRPATTSAAVIDRVIRGWIGFDGLLLSDDLSMQALGGSLGERAAASIEAGCDVALHCNGKLDEMQQVAGAIAALTDKAMDRIARGQRQRNTAPAMPSAAEIAAWRQRLDSLLEKVAA